MLQNSNIILSKVALGIVFVIVVKGEIVMTKRLLSLVFVFVLVFNIDLASLTFADDDDVFGSQGIPYNGGSNSYVNQCKDEFGNITDVDCAVKGKILDMKEFKAGSAELKEIGPNKEYDIHLWTYDNIDNFYHDMNAFIGTSIIELHKNNILTGALNQSTTGLKKFLHLPSEEACESFKKWIASSKYITLNSAEFEQIFNGVYQTLNHELGDLKEEYQKDYSKKGGIGGGILGAIGGFAAKGLTLCAAGPVVGGAIVCAAILGGIGYWIGGQKGESVYVEKANKKYLEDYNRFDIRTDVYANTIEQVFDKVSRSQWVGNDLLLAKLNFDSLYHRANTEFRKEDFPYDESKVEENFKDLKQKLNALLKKNNRRKEGFPYDEGKKAENNFKDLKQKLNMPLEKHNIRKDL